MRDGIEVAGRLLPGVPVIDVRRIRSTRNARIASRPWSCAARYQRPACTTSPYGLSSDCCARPRTTCTTLRSRCLRRIASASSRRVSPATGTPVVAASVNTSVVSSASTRRRSVAGKRGGSSRAPPPDAPTGVEPQPARGDEPEDDCHRLVVAEHQRRQPVAGPETVAAAHASLALDRDAQLLERFDVPADSAPIDTKVVGDPLPVTSGRDWNSSSSSRSRAVGVITLCSRAVIEGDIRPI